MGVTETSIQTKLSVKECGGLFQQAAVSAQGMWSKVNGLVARKLGGQGISFYSPTDDSPFSELDDDRPTFMVGVQIPRSRGGGSGRTTNIQMHVWDRGEHRDVLLISEFDFMGGREARELIGKISRAFFAADPFATALT